MRKEDLKDWTTDRLKDEIANLSKKNFNLEWRIKQFEENEGRWECKNKILKDENKFLKQQVDYLMDIFKTTYIPESAESMLRKTGFSQEVIDNAKERIESLKKELKAENTALKQRIKELEDIGNNYEPQFARDDDISAFNYECAKKWTKEMGCKRKIQELQDQHQQDCIKINQLHVAIDTLVDKYSRIRKSVGMD